MAVQADLCASYCAPARDKTMTLSPRRLFALCALLLAPAMTGCAIDENAELDPRVMDPPGIPRSEDAARQPGSAGANPLY